ncbi:histidine kinase [Streptomyces sp. NPDC012888]|uniref:sensor histidine kinase n=1 Tax=Streptomyces sp. NPDC012888 TaxID=3364855 RepID=UPI0036952F4E
MALAGLGVSLALVDVPRPSVQLLLLAVGAGLYPLCRRWPAAVLPTLAVLAGLAPGVGPVAAAASYTVARRTEPERRTARLLAAASVCLVGAATAAAPWLGPGPVAYGLALGLVLAPTAVVVPGLVGTAQGQQQRLLRALRERGDAAERARLLADSEARAHERARIAAEMHDLLGHRLSLISLHAGGLELALDRAAPELREEALLVRRTTRVAMRELRQALGVLGPLGRDTGPDALTDATGTRADVEALVAESRRGGVAVRFDWTGPDLDARPAPVRRAVHRVVREALTNVHRYAAAAHVAVAVEHGGEAVRVTVRNGAPPRPATATAAGEPGTGRGLTGLRERVALLGGTFEAAALPTGGFRVSATLPAEPPPAPAAAPAPPDGTEPPVPSRTQPGTPTPAGRAAAGPKTGPEPGPTAGRTAATRPGSGPDGAEPPRPARTTAGTDTPAGRAAAGPEPGPGTGRPALAGPESGPDGAAPLRPPRTTAGTATDLSSAAAPGPGPGPEAKPEAEPADGPRRSAELLSRAAGLVAVSVLMVLGAAFVYAVAPDPEAGPRPLPRVGMTYQQVAGLGVLDNRAVRAAAAGREPPRPAGTAGCVYPFNGATESHADGLTIARYCFDAAQRLIAIDRFGVPSVRDTTPWETP